MSDIESLKNDLVIASRILANEEICDAFGHISVRHPVDPDRFLLARAVAPELVTKAFFRTLHPRNIDGCAS